MTAIATRIRALHAAEPNLPRAELARRCATTRQNVHRAIGPKLATKRPAPPPIPPMDGAELAACLSKAGVTQAWVARWLGMRPSQIKRRMEGAIAVQPAEAVLFRLLASGDGELERHSIFCWRK